MVNYSLDDPIIKFSNAVAPWTFRHAFEGVQVFGGIGSGKSSGSGKKLATKFLEKGFGGLVLTVKHDELDVWKSYCKQANRLDDLIVIEPDGKYIFNFLEYESTNTVSNKSITDNIVQLLKTVIRASQDKESGQSQDVFWENALDMLMYNVIDLCKLAYGKISVQLMYDIVQSLPKAGLENSKVEKDVKSAFQLAYELAHKKITQLVRDWYNKTYSLGEKHAMNKEAFEHEYLKAVPEARLFNNLHSYFFDSFKNLNEKTRSIIDFIFAGFLFRLLKEPVYSSFCDGRSNCSPDDCFKGKIIIVNFPVKIYHKVGRDCQILFKYIWQRTMEKRDVRKNDTPVFLFADEAQNFIHEHDADFQATARASRVATVYLTQNLPNYYGSMGGKSGEYKVKSFIGTLATKIFHANSDLDTNNYASELIGKELITKEQHGISSGQSSSFSKNVSEDWELMYQPNYFIGLKNGGEINRMIVSAVLITQGSPIFADRNYDIVQFKQN